MTAFPQGKFTHRFDWSGGGRLTLSTLRNILSQCDDLPGEAEVQIHVTDDQRDGPYTQVTIDYTSKYAPKPLPSKPLQHRTAGGRIEDGA